MIKLIKEVIRRITWWNKTDRLGPDILSTHLLLFIPSLSRKLCMKKFKSYGEGAEFRPGAYGVACSNISLGKNVIIRPNTMLFATSNTEITIEDNVLMGSGVHIYVTNHEYRNSELDIIHQGHSKGKPVVLKRGCWIGANVIILPGVTIGENAVVGAGSIVTRDVPRRSLVVGNPAKIVRYIDD
ncbi:acyltransferase [Paucisalibacillus globulus]|uniref:acyltransferase n=1 Tax=Paucisalibacillus globulus TaxID=351095 RepID=UPI0004116693|nr:DapH/DapD/GlmU-related protein [Paucisalibacillus globulus]